MNMNIGQTPMEILEYFSRGRTTQMGNIIKTDAAKLRRQAEIITGSYESGYDASLSENAMRRLLHELQVNQIELELQNQELCKTRNEVESVLENYTDLYDFAPVGYCTLDRIGNILRVNLTGASLLGDQRSGLMNRSLGQYVSEKDKPLFKDMLNNVFNGQQKKANCEVSINPKGRRLPTTVKIIAMSTTTGNECLVVIIDITERKLLESQTRNAKDEEELVCVKERAAELLQLNSMLVQEINGRKQLEITLRDSQKRLRNLSTHLQSVREEERKAVAREIHDELGQTLATIQLGLSVLDGGYADHPNLTDRIKDMDVLIVNAIKTVQRISSELRPAMLDVLGLADALEWQSQEFKKRTDIDCTITIHLMNNVVNPGIATALFRIFQESLTNVQRHSRATKVEAQLVEKGQHFNLTVHDNGSGISKEEIYSPTSIGLIGIRERVYILGGRMKIFGSPVRGTALFVRVPTKSKEYQL